MYRQLNDISPEEEIRGELWLNLECGHRLRTAAASSEAGDATIPEKRQWCSLCDQRIRKPSPPPPEVRRVKKPSPIVLPRKITYTPSEAEASIRLINGVRSFFWRGSWRAW